ncbi:hypothetical protein AOQ88_01290 [Candidatus Riesia sp. GBBU]|nr:hypothetical protein AOQ88_01290 [Candidatus Riesia sp. GBBU]
MLEDDSLLFTDRPLKGIKFLCKFSRGIFDTKCSFIFFVQISILLKKLIYFCKLNFRKFRS